jgi:signal transduction histidine kinase
MVRTINRRRVAGAVAVACALLLAAGAERHGREPYPAIDLAAGCVILLSGAMAVSRRATRVPGVLLLLAAALWFAFTARLDLDARLEFGHRGLVMQALVAITVGTFAERAGPRLRVAAIAAVALGYVVALDRDRSLSPLWITASGAAAIMIVLAARPIARAAWLAVLGTTIWVLAAGIARDAGWFSPRAVLALYGAGLALVSASVAAQRLHRVRPRTSDIVRDGGPGDLRVGFRLDGESAFEDLAGLPFALTSGDPALVLELGDGLGRAVVVHSSGALDTPRVQRELVAGLRLLAAHRVALRDLQSQAVEVSASAHRIRAADALATAALAAELERAVTGRVARVVNLLSGDTSEIGSEARRSLADVLDEVGSLAGGLAPKALDAGIVAGLATLAESQAVPVHISTDGVAVDGRAALAFYLAAAECLTNAIRHGASGQVDITLRAHEGEAVLEVSDDGRGGAAVVPGGGLAGLRARLIELGGSLAVNPRAGGGTVVTVRLPAADRAAAVM